jgi:hypothetical protein
MKKENLDHRIERSTTSSFPLSSEQRIRQHREVVMRWKGVNYNNQKESGGR